MINEGLSLENEINSPRDLSSEFSTMDRHEFENLVRKLKDIPELKIVTDWTNKYDARYLKAFVERAGDGQKRSASIRATKEQKNQEPNVFGSGVEWIEIST